MKCKLEEICSFRRGKTDVANLTTETYISTENMLPNKSGIVNATSLPTVNLTRAFENGDVLVSNIRPYFKKIWKARINGGCSNDVLVFMAKEDIDSDFLYYVLADDAFFAYAMATSKGTKMPRGDKKSIMQYEVPCYDVETQQKIASILKSIDEKIELNNAINNNLLEQVLSIYRHRFIDTANELRQTCRADEYFDISIGKTPPRKELQWFSTNPKDVTWVSITDMGTCGLYISESSEQLTREAVDRHNVKIVPDNTILLSFKLTVGRIAITNGEMSTNEAIAHFKTDKKEINEYLYCYLKYFNYQTMGSTSSIATAVNSKIIKSMPFVIPTDDEINEFHSLAAPMFAKIKANQSEISNLTVLRDTLLPKLMSGEFDISDMDI